MNDPDHLEDLLLTGDQVAEWVDASTILVVVDVSRPSVADTPALLRVMRTVAVLDYHRQSSEIIDNVVSSYMEPYASSTRETVVEVLQYITDGTKIESLETDTICVGVIIDTNSFTNQVGVRTFKAAAYLRRNSADITRVRKLFRSDMSDYKTKAEAVWMAGVFKGALTISVCPAERVENPTIVVAQAANELSGINGTKASVVLSRYNDTIYLSACSIDEVDAQAMMEKLGGGGHRAIAEAQPSGITVEEAIERLKIVTIEMPEKGDIS